MQLKVMYICVKFLILFGKFMMDVISVMFLFLFNDPCKNMVDFDSLKCPSST